MNSNSYNHHALFCLCFYLIWASGSLYCFSQQREAIDRFLKDGDSTIAVEHVYKLDDVVTHRDITLVSPKHLLYFGPCVPHLPGNPAHISVGHFDFPKRTASLLFTESRGGNNYFSLAEHANSFLEFGVGTKEVVIANTVSVPVVRDLIAASKWPELVREKSPLPQNGSTIEYFKNGKRELIAIKIYEANEEHTIYEWFRKDGTVCLRAKVLPTGILWNTFGNFEFDITLLDLQNDGTYDIVQLFYSGDGSVDPDDSQAFAISGANISPIEPSKNAEFIENYIGAAKKYGAEFDNSGK